MADDVLANMAAVYEQLRTLEEQHGPRIVEISARHAMLDYLVLLLGQPVDQVPSAATFLSSIGRVPLVRDDDLPDGIVRLAYTDRSRRDVFVPYVPLPVLPPIGELDG